LLRYDKDWNNGLGGIVPLPVGENLRRDAVLPSPEETKSSWSVGHIRVFEELCDHGETGCQVYDRLNAGAFEEYVAGSTGPVVEFLV